MLTIERLAVSTWSFHKLFEAEPPMEALDFPQMIADRYGIHNVEIVLPHLSSTEPSYLEAFKQRLTQAHSRIVHMRLDFKELWEGPALAAADAQERARAVELYRQGIDVAAAIGCPAVRGDPGIVSLDDLSITIGSYRNLVPYAQSKGIEVLVENHGSISRNPDVLVRILESSGARALPDIGNFPDDTTRERGLRALYPLASSICHAKLDSRFDLAKYLRIAKDSGFRGLFSVEATGEGDPYEEVQKIQTELLSQ